MGEFENSGAGNPPHQETNEEIYKKKTRVKIYNPFFQTA